MSKLAYEEPTLVLRYGSGAEASATGRAELEARRLGHEQLPDADAVFESYPDLRGVPCLFVSGSVTQGWGHANSDLDLFAITDEPLALDGSTLEVFERHISTEDPVIWIAVGEVGHFRADVEVWRTSQVDEVIGRFAGGTPDQEKPELGRSEKELLYRLTVGLPLVGDEFWRERRERILTSGYGMWLAENAKLNAEGGLEDVAGLLRSGDGESAALAARETFIAGLEALLATYGDYCLSRKWLYRRLTESAPRELSQKEGRDALTMAGCTEDPAGWAERTAELVQRMLLAVEEKAV